MSMKVESSPADLAKAAKTFLEGDTKTKWVASKSWAERVSESYNNTPSTGGNNVMWAASKVAAFVLYVVTCWNVIHNWYGYGMENKGEGFVPSLKSFTAKQGQLNDVEKRSGEAFKKLNKEALAARGALVRTVVNLTSGVEAEVAKARVKTATDMIQKGLEEEGISKADARTATDRVVAEMRKQYVEDFMSKYSVETLAGDVQGELQKQAIEAADRGIFANSGAALEAFVNVMHKKVKDASKKTIDDKIEALSKRPADADVAARKTTEQQEYNSLKAKRDAIGVKPDASKSEKPEEFTHHDGSVTKLTFKSGTLHDLEIEELTARNALEKQEARDEAIMKKYSNSVTHMERQAVAGNRDAVIDVTEHRSIQEELKKQQAALKQVNEKIAKARKEFTELTDKMQAQARVLGGDAEHPSEAAIERCISENNDTIIRMLKTLSARALPEEVTSLSEDDIKAQLAPIVEALEILKADGALTRQNAAAVEKAVPAVCERIAGDNMYADLQDDRLAGRRKAALKIELEAQQRRMNSALDAAEKRVSALI